MAKPIELNPLTKEFFSINLSNKKILLNELLESTQNSTALQLTKNPKHTKRVLKNKFQRAEYLAHSVRATLTEDLIFERIIEAEILIELNIWFYFQKYGQEKTQEFIESRLNWLETTETYDRNSLSALILKNNIERAQYELGETSIMSMRNIMEMINALTFITTQATWNQN